MYITTANKQWDMVILQRRIDIGLDVQGKLLKNLKSGAASLQLYDIPGKERQSVDNI
jgi:hypothetical protein